MLGTDKYSIDSASTGAAGLGKITHSNYDLLLLDLKLPDICGMDILKIVKEKRRGTDVIVMTGLNTDELRREAINLGAYDYLSKPFTIHELSLLVEHCLEKRRLCKEIGRYRDINTLVEISNAMGSAKELDQLLNIILESALHTVRGDSGSLMLFNEEDNELSIRASHGLSTGIADNVKIKIGERIAGWVAKNGEPLLIIDGLEEKPQFNHLKARGEIKSSICVPLKVRDKIIGILNVNNLLTSPHQFTKHELDFISILAQSTALIVENFSLREKLTGHARNLEQKVKITQDKLFQSEKMSAIARVINYVAHELRKPLSNIKVFSQLCLESKTGQAEGKTRERLEVILRNAEKGSKMIDDIMTFSRPAKITFRNTSIREILDSICKTFQGEELFKNIKFSCELSSEIPVTKCDAGNMERVFYNIVKNGIQAMPQGGKFFIKAEFDAKDSKIVVSFTDTGTGIPEDIIEHVFEPFFTAREGGMGLGLAFTEEIIKLHNGDIRIESKKGQGTIVIVKLPVD